MNARSLTLLAMEAHDWSVVLLEARSKRPVGLSWTVTRKTSVVSYHLEKGGNVGLVCGEVSGIAVLDFDEPTRTAAIFAALGPLDLWAQGRPTKPGHAYVRWEDHLPTSIFWEDEKVGEILRGPGLQHVVLPPSIHPDTGQPYRWLSDPGLEIPALPDAWRAYLIGGVAPGVEVPPHLLLGAGEGVPEVIPWEGPPVDVLIARAMHQPGARVRRYGIKFQCPGCRAEGHDKARDNAVVYNDGRWGCALDPSHKRDIGQAIGMTEDDQALVNEMMGETALDRAADDILKKMNG